LNQELYDNVKKQLEPIFAKFYKTSESYRIYKVSVNLLLKKLDRINAIQKSLIEWDNLVNEKAFPIKYVRLMDTFTYLLQVEMFGNHFVNLTLLLMVGKGDFLHLNPDYKHRYVRHAKSLKDIESPTLTLSTKLDFLKANGINFFDKWINRRLRNKIAHGDFFIDEGGKFFIIDSKGEKKEIDLDEIRNQFIDYHEVVPIVFLEYFKQANVHPTPRA